MQQKLTERRAFLCKDAGSPCGVALLQLPFRCPRCGERQRLRGLSSLRAHLDYGHAYHTVHSLSPTSRWDAGDERRERGEPEEASCTEECRSAASEPTESAGREKEKAGAATEGTAGEQEAEPVESERRGSAGGSLSLRLTRIDPAEACARRGLDQVLRVTDSTLARRLRRVSTDLAQVDMELLHAHARFEHLAREKQQVRERERALCRQVETAVMEIGRLREQLTLSEQELEKKQLEVVSIHNFLEAAAQHEMCGKARLQRFIENILQRIALAERLLEYYQSIANMRHCRNYLMFQPVENGLNGLSENSEGGFTEQSVEATFVC
ncbi:protein ZNF365 isoform X2 [Scleropages formosus]|uniref:Zinc finger protein 365 n=1 Tax=Scleropages formosus TaxID=113540 RepID=A0A8C9TZC5_SCLFO|nr:protein ZNF365 isoform X2 [Scleropages formosus]